MKKHLFCWTVAAFLVACGNEKSNTNTNSGDSGPNTPNVQNVNGNIPDTMGSKTLDNRQSADSNNKDTSIRR